MCVVFDGYINKFSTKDQAHESGSSSGNVTINTPMHVTAVRPFFLIIGINSWTIYSSTPKEKHSCQQRSHAKKR